MPAEPLFSLVSEVEDHLRLKKEDLTVAGMEATQAEKVAVQSFGDPDEVALEALDGGSSLQRRTKGAWLALGAMGAIWLFAAIIAGIGFNPGFVLPLFTPFLAAGAVFLVGSAMSRRWQWKSILVVSAISTLVVMLCLPFGFQTSNGAMTSRHWIAFEVGWVGRQLEDEQAIHHRLDSGLAFYHQLASVKGDLKKVTLTAPKFNDGSFVGLPNYQIYDPSVVGLASSIRGSAEGELPNEGYYGRYGIYGSVGPSTRNLAEAQKAWLTNGPQQLRSVTEMEVRLKSELDGLRAAQTAPMRFGPAYIAAGSGVGIAFTLALLVGSGIATIVARLSRRRRIRRPLLA